MIELLSAPSIDPWVLMTAGLIIAVAEVIVPGFIIFWFGAGAVVIGLISFMFPLFWWAQILMVCMIAPIGIFATRRWALAKEAEKPPVIVNKRAAALIGRSFKLIHPISAGRGEIFADDTRWDVTGPDLPAGTLVKVTGAGEISLEVERG